MSRNERESTSEARGDTPAIFRVPAEWESRDATLLAWPTDRLWASVDEKLSSLFRALVKLLREHEPVRLLVPPDERDRLARELGGEDESLLLEPLVVNDVWVRDAGPISALRQENDGSSTPVFLDGGFNGWGERHPHEMDRLIPTVLSRRWGLQRVRLPITVEGGGVEANGRGDLLTTRCVMHDPKRRNPPGEEVERALQYYFGAKRVHWLRRGLEHDDTGGHIDNLARFVSPNGIVCPGSDIPVGHPDTEVLRENRRALGRVVTSEGPAEIHELPVPDVRGPRGRRLAASYANFYLAPGLVLVPLFGETADDRAQGVMGELFPGRKVVGMDARPLLLEGGAFHCMTQPLRFPRAHHEKPDSHN